MFSVNYISCVLPELLNAIIVYVKIVWPILLKNHHFLKLQIICLNISKYILYNLFASLAINPLISEFFQNIFIIVKMQNFLSESH